MCILHSTVDGLTYLGVNCMQIDMNIDFYERVNYLNGNSIFF